MSKCARPGCENHSSSAKRYCSRRCLEIDARDTEIDEWRNRIAMRDHAITRLQIENLKLKGQLCRLLGRQTT